MKTKLTYFLLGMLSVVVVWIVLGLIIWSKDKQPDTVSRIFSDNAGRIVCLRDDDNDGKWDQWSFATGTNVGSFNLIDRNLDGVFDLRYETTQSQSVASVFYKSQWYETVPGRGILIDGNYKAVHPTPDGWEFTDEPKEDF